MVHQLQTTAFRSAVVRESSELTSLENIEKHLRQQWLEKVSPQIGFFFIKQATGTEQGRPRTVKRCIGELIITEKQAEKLEVKKSALIISIM